MASPKTQLQIHSAKRAVARAENRLGPVQLLGIVAASALATQVKTLAESVLQPRAEKWLPPSDAEKKLAGADPTGHPENMPPTKLADKVSETVEETDALNADGVPDDVQEKIPPVLHWVMGIGLGTGYGLLAHRFPAIRKTHGVAFGAVAFAATHGSTLPALGLQDSPTKLPKSWWVWELGSHVVYAVTVDTVLRVGDALAALSKRS